MKKVSVIIPFFNVEDYITDCLRSILDQTYGDIEVICVNDDSLDNSVSLVKNLVRRDERLSLLHQPAHLGPGAARNLGLRHARGGYIKFVDSDDILPAWSLESLVAALERTEADWAFSAFHVMDAAGCIYNTRSPFHTEKMESIGATGLIDFTKDPTLLNEMWPSPPFALYRSEKLRSTRALFPEGLHFEDHEFFFLHGFQCKSAAYLTDQMYIYRDGRSGQITRDASRRVFDVFPVLERLLPIYARHLTGETLLRFSARSCIRLICERSWVIPKGTPMEEEFRAKARAFLARFPRKVLLESRDWYIDERALLPLLPSSDAGQLKGARN